jgi:methylated-DNA-protein-cysteine methyltransferase-like protein
MPRETPPLPSSGRADAVLELVDSIPAGRVMTYGDVARVLGIPSARTVGQLLARSGDVTAWHRVVLSTGYTADHLTERQLGLLQGEGVPIRHRRVDLRQARWNPSSLVGSMRPGPD